MKKRFLLSFLVMGLLIYLFGCMAAAFKDLTRKSFSAPEFTTYEMETGKVALLPIVASPEYSRSLNVTLIDSFQTFHPGITAIGGDESRRLLQDAGVIEEYSQMIDTYFRTAIINRSVVSKMGEAVRARYLLYTRLLKYDEYKHPEKERTIYELSIKAEIWDSRTGEVVWDATGHGRITQTLLDKPVIFEDIAFKVCDSLMKKLP